ncbi:MAG: 2OG-Fe(II) oxygenase [Mycobacterium sp.]
MSGPEVMVIENALTASMCAALAQPPVPDHKGRHLNPRDPSLSLTIGAIDRLVRRIATQHFGVTPTIGERRLLGYGPGDFMAAHRDNEYEGATFAGRAHPVPRVPFGCCFYLDAPSSYSGGALRVEGHPPIRPPKGAAVFIRGDIRHRVKKITSGHRSILKVIATVPADPRWRFHNATASWSRVT